MTSEVPAPAPKWMRWLGFTLSGLVIFFLLMDATMKLMQLAIVLETTAQSGGPVASVVPLGIVLLLCTALYALPQTSVLGAVLLTGYLGGTVATLRASAVRSSVTCSLASTSASCFGADSICGMIACGALITYRR